MEQENERDTRRLERTRAEKEYVDLLWPWSGSLLTMRTVKWKVTS